MQFNAKDFIEDVDFLRKKKNKINWNIRNTDFSMKLNSEELNAILFEFFESGFKSIYDEFDSIFYL